MRVFVTGLGVISGIGTNVKENLKALSEGIHGIDKVTLFHTNLDVPVSEVKLSNSELKRILYLKPEKIHSRTALLGMMAAKEAIEDAKLNIERTGIGFISSTSVGGMDLSENFFTTFREGHSKGRLQNIIHHDCADSTEQIAQYIGHIGFMTTISTACSSAANAIMLGSRLIKSGYLDTAIVGGTDALCRFTLNGFNSLMILDKEHCRPFDKTRAGLNLGEGAGYVVLQSEETISRKPYCEVTGYANVNEAYHQTGSSPEGEGPYKSMTEALRMSGISPREIGYINVHGTGTPNNDLSEGKALLRLFSKEGDVPPFSSVKAFIGHTLGASEGIEAVYSVLSIEKGSMYPNLNFSTSIDETDLSPITSFHQGLDIKHVLSNSFGFGGSNSSLVFSKVEDRL
ncbi:MAG: beta-ketoacyl-[acyl-carrier-protein] synthase family protein [Bacteroides sp.]|nr:beta-ketoacyl-[acyl-carrier-protein] synthase family protein [Bacteroides sp.]